MFGYHTYRVKWVFEYYFFNPVSIEAKRTNIQIAKFVTGFHLSLPCKVEVHPVAPEETGAKTTNYIVSAAILHYCYRYFFHGIVYRKSLMDDFKVYLLMTRFGCRTLSVADIGFNLYKRFIYIEIGRAHVRTPVTGNSPMPSSA